jgi:hypothetical protein
MSLGGNLEFSESGKICSRPSAQMPAVVLRPLQNGNINEKNSQEVPEFLRNALILDKMRSKYVLVLYLYAQTRSPPNAPNLTCFRERNIVSTLNCCCGSRTPRYRYHPKPVARFKETCLKKIIVSSSLCVMRVIRLSPIARLDTGLRCPTSYRMRMGGPSVSWMDGQRRVGRGIVLAQT